MIRRNAAECRRCGDVIESKHLHDFVTCGCGAISVDGGKSYLKRSARWDVDDVIERSETPDILSVGSDPNTGSRPDEA